MKLPRKKGRLHPGANQPCDCLLDGQLAIGTQVCGLNGEYGDCECDSDGNGQGNERRYKRAARPLRKKAEKPQKKKAVR